MVRASTRPPARRLTGILAALCLLVAARSPAQHQGERDTGFQLSLSQRYERPVGLEASIRTTATYPCEGYQLQMSTELGDDTISVTILGMRRPSPCVPLPAEATGRVYLGTPRSPSPVLRITYRGETDLHVLSISNGKVSARPLRNRFTTVRGK